jgi:hypothetical protein
MATTHSGAAEPYVPLGPTLTCAASPCVLCPAPPACPAAGAAAEPLVLLAMSRADAAERGVGELRHAVLRIETHHGKVGGALLLLPSGFWGISRSAGPHVMGEG